MGGFRVGAGMAVVGLIAGCATESGLDLAINPSLYYQTGYQANIGVDRQVFITPVQDKRGLVEVPVPEVLAREAQASEATSPYPVQLLSDARWDRPMPVMVDEIVRREVAESGIFAQVLEQATAEACVLQIVLEDALVGVEERTNGRRSMARMRLRAKVYSPAVGGAERQVWFDEPFDVSQISDVGMQPISPRFLAGSSLRTVVANMLGAIDQSNLARSQVPMNVK